MSSGRVPDYLGKGLAASRPATPDLNADTLGFWWSTDTEELSAWTGAEWKENIGRDPDSAVDQVNGKTGVVVLTERDILSVINAQTGTSYTAVLTDEIVTMDNAAANTFIVPPNSSVAFPVTRSLELWQKGAGQTTVVAGAGVTILKHSSNTLKLKGQNSGASLRKVATDTWRLIGDMEQV